MVHLVVPVGGFVAVLLVLLESGGGGVIYPRSAAQVEANRRDWRVVACLLPVYAVAIAGWYLLG